MKHIIVLERDDLYFDQIKTQFKELGEYEVVRHIDVQELFGWLKQVIASSKEGGKKPNIGLFVIEEDLLTEKLNVALLAKMRDLLVQGGLTDPEQPAGFILTSYSTSLDKISAHIHETVFNIIHKPFDKMTLKEFLNVALAGRAPIATEMYQHDGEVVLEIIKLIPLRAVSEIGFRTQASRPIESGNKARYISEHFGSKETPGSIFAYCTNTEKQEDEKFEGSFSFFGAGQEDLRKVRINIQKANNKESEPILNEDEKRIDLDKKVIILTANPELFEDTKSKIEDRFEQIEFLHAKTIDESLEEEDSGIAGFPVEAVFVHKEIHKNNDFENIKEYIDKRCDPKSHIKYFAIDEEPLSNYQSMKRYQDYADFFTLPLDRFYFDRKLKQHCPNWKIKNKEVLTRDIMSVEDSIKSAIEVPVNKISEIGLTLMYHRELPVTTLRTFIIPSVDGTSEEEVTAMCHYSEKIEKDVFKNDFIFVGVTDHQQKFIRKWMVAKYANAKAKANG
ncbi:MAG: hypothetical protein CL677_06520 [Bdellovibrionaceae bacterium]|nr:hypothetical protein [Pseudobdellovibrionaceae bacterium]|tara:strand:- start:6452 stop:7966 length:1515 start_codon:yes stop_codon:yes gene_type:complete